MGGAAGGIRTHDFQTWLHTYIIWKALKSPTRAPPHLGGQTRVLVVTASQVILVQPRLGATRLPSATRLLQHPEMVLAHPRMRSSSLPGHALPGDTAFPAWRNKWVGSLCILIKLDSSPALLLGVFFKPQCPPLKNGTSNHLSEMRPCTGSAVPDTSWVCSERPQEQWQSQAGLRSWAPQPSCLS